MASVTKPVTVSLHDLATGSVSFDTLIQAFGPDSLGILIVTDLPETFPALREKVLSDSSRLADLPADKLRNLENSNANYLVGWSHGKETLRPGVVDTLKGSYYINCAFYNDPQLEEFSKDGQRFPGFEGYTAPNIWPESGDIAGFQASAESLISLIIDTATLVARAIDRFAVSEIDGYQPKYLENMVAESRTTKARLLHYFPSIAQSNGNYSQSNGSSASDTDDSWCATHLDHGCLTGLTSAMFLDENSSSSLSELPASPSPKSGLYIRSRSGEVHKVGIPRNALGFQTGEALELITQGKLKAVPHFVQGVDPAQCGESQRIARNTLAVFTQPNLDKVVDVRNGLTFGEFAKGVVRKNTVAA